MVTDLSNWSEEQEVEDEHEDASQGNKEDSSKDTEVESVQFNQGNKIVSPRRGSRIRRIPERFNDYLVNSVGENYVFQGTQFGTVLILPIAGYLAASPWGWPSIFYCTGLCGVLWSVVWLFVGADSPDSHPSINDREREYINSSLVETSSESNSPVPWSPGFLRYFCRGPALWGAHTGPYPTTNAVTQFEDTTSTSFGWRSPSKSALMARGISDRNFADLRSRARSSNTMPTPWRQILTSGPMWALLIASLCHEWGYSMLLIEVPSYLSHVFGFDIKQQKLPRVPPKLAFALMARDIYDRHFPVLRSRARSFNFRLQITFDDLARDLRSSKYRSEMSLAISASFGAAS
ncbi:hypothetical protein J6590_061695 [Homalodisca vitripennis]|nr:hypothetical protein J6590_061695 [Homalodisca vitripennis]